MMDENNVLVKGSHLTVRNFMWHQVQKLLFRLRSMRSGPLAISLLCGLLAGEIQAPSALKAQAPEVLNQFNNSVEALVRKIFPSVVQVLVPSFVVSYGLSC
jgi:hypothetical protein